MTAPASTVAELGVFTRGYCLEFARTSKHPPARLWRAITDSEELTRWMAYPARIDARVGGEYFVDFRRTNGGELDGVIVTLEHQRHLRYAWGTSVVDWKLEPDGHGTRHVFAQHGLYVREITGEEGLAAGWHVWLEDLEQFLDTGSPSSEKEGEARWLELQTSYRRNLEAVVALQG